MSNQKDIILLFEHIAQLSEGMIDVVDRMEKVIESFNQNFDLVSKQAKIWDARTKESKDRLDKVESIIAGLATDPAQRPSDQDIINYMEIHGVNWDEAIRKIMEEKSG